MKSINVNLRNNNYQIKIGNFFEKSQNDFQSSLSALKGFEKNAFILFDGSQRKVAQALCTKLKKLKWKCETISIRAGESLKDLNSLIPIYEKLLSKKANRRSVLFAVGGGTVGDSMGFVAGTYMRGMGLVYIPTTLLSQVDSSLGGKCGVNLKSGKNLVGIFNQPNLVLCDLNLLRTLSQRDVISGVGELIKMALLFDEKMFLNLQKNKKQILQMNANVISELLKKSLELKAKVVQKDERDMTGQRELLNFGHTFAHAIEKTTRFSQYRHGEAVILGMRAELKIAVIKKLISKNDFAKIDSFLKSISVPRLSKKISFKEFLDCIQKDKKQIKGQTRFVLLKKIGKPVLVTNVKPVEIKAALDWIQK